MILKLGQGVALFLAYIALGKLGIHFLSLNPGNLTVLWFPSGIALIAIILFGFRVLPFVWLASFLTNFDGLEASGGHLESWQVYLVDILSSTFDTIQPMIAVTIWRRVITSNLTSTTDFYKFVFFVALIPCFVVSLLLCSNLFFFDFFKGKTSLEVFQVFVMVSLGDAIGILVVVPLFLYWRDGKYEGNCFVFSGLIAFQSILLLTVIYFLPFLYFLSFFVLILFGYFYRRKGISFGILQLYIFSILMTKLKVGPFAHDDTFVSYVYLISFLVPFSMLAELITLLYEQVESHRLELENQVIKRTKLLRQEIVAKNNAIEALNTSEKKLTDSNQTKDKFFSIIAHDLKNPISGYQQITRILLDEYGKYTDEQRIEVLSQINESSTKLYQLLEHLLDWSRTQSNTMPFHPGLFNLIDVIHDSVNEIENKLILKKITTSILGVSVAFTCADQSMIRLVIRNFLSNALKFTPIGGRIDLLVSESEDSFSVECKDTGIGMSKETLQKLFRIDVPLASTGLEGERGTGLGLILCNEFIQMHQGKIWATSEQGRGTSVSFSLPKKSSHR
ncbi:MAG: ATP-binding protein [Rhodobacteraceae bacterium]|nr:ATP-binding protein [Paracoccaceae bacterium]